MSENINRKIVLARRPTGMPDESCFKIVESQIPEIQKGQVLVKIEYLSVDPYMRGRMSERKSYSASYQLNEVITGGAVGQVAESKSNKFTRGDYVTGMLGWTEYFAAGENELRKIDSETAPVTTALGILGMPGLTAYFGLLDIGNPKAGETVVVSAAAGAVGSVVGQIAKIKQCRVVGIAGSERKIEYLKNELNFDASINYHKANLKNQLQEACPHGVDIYFDNVGGEISDAVMSLINDNARIPICGQISVYNSTEIPVGPRIQGLLLSHTAMMKGFLIRQYANRFDEAVKVMAGWLKDGKLKYEETITNGLENTPAAFIGLFRGENIGKQLVKIS
ncbi:MAG: NADP-dependent oxidoreductase [Bacillota bacterium]